LARLSFVNVTLWCKNHMNIFTFSETFILQIFFLKYLAWSFRIYKYMDLTVNPRGAVKPQTKTSRSLIRCMCITRNTSSNHNHHLFSDRERRNVICNKEWLKYFPQNLFSLDGLKWRYLLCTSSCHTPSFNSLNIQFLKMYLFF
jgi:hypothetical protein